MRFESGDEGDVTILLLLLLTFIDRVLNHFLHRVLLEDEIHQYLRLLTSPLK